MTLEEQIELTCQNCGNCAVCNPALQRASAHRLDSTLITHLLQFDDGVFALFNSDGRLLYTGKDWNAVLTAYRERPRYTRAPRPPRVLVAPRGRGKISSEQKAANTAKLLAALKGASQ